MTLFNILLKYFELLCICSFFYSQIKAKYIYFDDTYMYVIESNIRLQGIYNQSDLQHTGCRLKG